MTAVFHSTGLGGISQDQAKALLHYSFASFGSHPEAEMALGFRFLSGIGTPSSCENAVSHYQRAAEMAVAQFKHGSPSGIPSPPAKPKLSDDHGGVYGIGTTGRGDTGDPTAGASSVTQDDLIQFYQYNADRGDVAAQVALGQAYYHGTQSIPPNYERALRYFRMALSQLPSQTEQSPTITARLAAQAAAYLGVMSWRGDGVQPDPNLALKLFHRAASHGSAAALNNLGLMYLNGIVVPKNTEKAKQFFIRSAEKENADAFANLGIMYLQRLKPDYTAAFEYLSNAVRAGNLMALYHVGRMYQRGLGVTKSCVSAATVLFFHWPFQYSLCSISKMLPREEISIGHTWS